MDIMNTGGWSPEAALSSGERLRLALLDVIATMGRAIDLEPDDGWQWPLGRMRDALRQRLALDDDRLDAPVFRLRFGSDGNLHTGHVIALHEKFGSIRRLDSATDEEIRAVPDIGRARVAAIRRAIKRYCGQ